MSKGSLISLNKPKWLTPDNLGLEGVCNGKYIQSLSNDTIF